MVIYRDVGSIYDVPKHTNVLIKFKDDMNRWWYGKVKKDFGRFFSYLEDLNTDSYNIYYMKIKIIDNNIFIVDNHFIFDVKKDVERIVKYLGDKSN